MTERFWAKVDKTGDCWIWTGARVRGMHGHLTHKRKNHYAHRFSYELHYGPIPAGLEVRHKCDNPPCVNPDHLELGTHAQNMRDMAERGRSSRGEQHPPSKLTDAEVEEIRSLKGAVSQSVLAKRYSVNQSTISLIQSGRRRSSGNPPLCAPLARP